MLQRFYQSRSVLSHGLNMLTVKKFLFCLKLETGGLFMGWSGIISSLLFFLGFIVSLTFSFHDIVDYINRRFGISDGKHLPMMSEYLNFRLIKNAQSLTVSQLPL